MPFGCGLQSLCRGGRALDGEKEDERLEEDGEEESMFEGSRSSKEYCWTTPLLGTGSSHDSLRPRLEAHYLVCAAVLCGRNTLCFARDESCGVCPMSKVLMKIP